MEILRSDEHTRTGGPEDLAGIVVLSLVFFCMSKDPAAAKCVAVFVHESTCSAGVLEIGFVGIRLYFGLTSSNFRLLFHQRADRIEPSRSYFNVGVEQYIQLCRNGLQAIVVSFGKSTVLFVLNDLNGRVLLTQKRNGIVGGGIVNDPQLCTVGMRYYAR